MKIRIQEKLDQPLLYRQELNLEVDYEKEVPSREFLREQIAKAVKADKEMVVVESIKSVSGKHLAKVQSHVYNDKKKMDLFVRDYLKKRHEKKGEKDGQES